LCKKLGFQLYQQNKSQMIAINSNPKQLFAYFFSCISLGTYKPGLWIVEFDVTA
jgi:hypothetical protein